MKAPAPMSLGLLAHLQESAGSKLADIADLFVHGAKLTLIVRQPGKPEQDFVLTDDNILEAIAALHRRAAGHQGEPRMIAPIPTGAPANFKWPIPASVPHMQAGVDRYLNHGVPPGRFLLALFSNDLVGVFSVADEANTKALRDWVGFMRWEMPSKSHGSADAVRAWIEQHEAARQEAASVAAPDTAP